MATPTVSILLPTYHPDPQLLRRTVECVLSQTVTDWTLLIHDDPAGENIPAMLGLLLDDPRIRFVQSPVRLGIGGNWNASFAAAQSAAPFTAYIFQDDHWDPHYLERAVAALQKHPSAGIVAMMHTYEFDSFDPLSHQYQTTEAERRHLFKEEFAEGKPFLLAWLRRGLHPNLIGEPSFVVWRTELLKETPWDSVMAQCLDAEGWARALQKADVAFVPESSGTFLVHQAAASAQNRRAHRGMLDRFTILLRLSRSHDREIRKAASLAVLRELPKMGVKLLRRLTGG